jgi:Homeodomain-like domain
MTTYTAEQIEAIGGNRWRKNGMDRVYLDSNVWAALIGLEIGYYNSGNISWAQLNGEDISNGRARDILGCIGKVYWDSIDGRIHITVYRNRYSGEVPGWIRAAIAKAVAALKDNGDATGGESAATIITGLRETGRTVRQIAEAVGVSISTVYRWALGVSQPRPTNALALAALAI